MPPLYELRALLTFFCLHAQSHNLIVHHHHPSSHTLAYNLLSAFPDSFNSSNTHVIFDHNSTEASFPFIFHFFAFVYHTPPGFDFGLHVHVQHDAIII